MPTIKKLVELASIDLAHKVHEKILSDIPPPNAKSTLKRKFPKTHTLIHTGELLGSISWTLTAQAGSIVGEVGIFAPKIVSRALANEFGTEHIPARSFLRSAFDEHIDGIVAGLKENILEELETTLFQQKK